MLAVLLGPALAQDFIVQVGEPQTWDQAGVWSRPLRHDGSWKLGLATANDYWVGDLVAGDGFGEWELDRESLVNLTNRGDLKDHSIKRCPDGSYLVASSANIVDPNDSSYWTWVDADFAPLGSGTVEETSNERPHNDLLVICSELATGVVHAEFGHGGEEFESTLFHIDLDQGVTGTSTLANFKSEGGSIVLDTRNDTLVGADATLFFIGGISVWSADYQVVEHHEVEFVDGDWKETWPQGLHRLGDYFLVATLARDEEVYGRGDGDGEVWLVVLDSDFEVLERRRLTTFLDEGNGANRPWIARHDDRLMIGFDRDVRHGVLEVEIDLDAFGVDGSEDTGSDPLPEDTAAEEDPGDGDSSGDGDGGADPDGCGCTAAALPGLGLVALVGVVALRRRRGTAEQLGSEVPAEVHRPRPGRPSAP